MLCVPVVDVNQVPLMPTTPNRAASWVKSGKGTYFWKKGIYCVRLNVEPSGRATQDVVVGVDPGSKKEGFTVKTEARTLLNIQADARIGIKEKLEVRRKLRRTRRGRNTPYRPCRLNRNINKEKLPPSTHARWQWKKNILQWLAKMFPINKVIVEDIKARTRKGSRNWNRSFSPLQVGKNWFYNEVRKLAKLDLIVGYETANLRKQHGLTKSSNKMAEHFSAHCVDSWVMANSIVGGHVKPDNTAMLYVKPLVFARRQLHRLQPSKGGKRNPYGGTRSLGFKRGSLVRHVKYGLSYIGGASKGRVSLHDLVDKTRLTQHARADDCKFLSYLNFLTISHQRLKPGVSLE